MKQLTVKDIFILINQLKKAGYTTEEIAAMPVYIGDDDELNGIHTAWCASLIEPDDDVVMEMINNNFNNMPVKGNSILIS